jgi:hypothetical protein
VRQVIDSRGLLGRTVGDIVLATYAINMNRKTMLWTIEFVLETDTLSETRLIVVCAGTTYQFMETDLRSAYKPSRLRIMITS